MSGLDAPLSRLLVDVGNTRIKALAYDPSRGDACFDEDSLWVQHDRKFKDAFSELFSRFSKPEDIWVSNVAGLDAATDAELAAWERWGVNLNFAVVERDCCGLRNNYENLSELGVDRWMAMQGARKLKDGALIVVGCGTAITIDVISKESVFVGGAILPGLELAAQSLSQTNGISKFDFHEYADTLGVSTADCVRVGVINACAGGVEKVIRAIREQFSDDFGKVVLSGGAAKMIFSATNVDYEYDANLVLRGLQCVANERFV